MNRQSLAVAAFVVSMRKGKTSEEAMLDAKQAGMTIARRNHRHDRHKAKNPSANNRKPSGSKHARKLLRRAKKAI